MHPVLPFPTGHLSSSVSPATIKGRGRLNAKIKTAKISSEGETGFSRKFGPAKISHYTTLHWFKGHRVSDDYALVIPDRPIYLLC